MWIGTDAGLYRDQTLEAELGEGAIRHITRHGDDVYVATDSDVWVRNGSWHRLGSLPDGVRARWLMPTETGLLVGTSGAQVYRWLDGGFRLDTHFNDMPTRPAWHTPWGGPPSIWSACSSGPNIWVNVHVGGIVHSTDGGAHWDQNPLPIETDVHQVSRTSSGDLLIASARGFAKSSNGSDWTFDNDGLHGHYLRAVTTTPNAIFVTASHGPRSDEVAVYRRRSASEPFERTALTDEWLAENIDAPAMTSAGRDVAFGTRDGRVYRSDNDGDDWQLGAEHLPPIKSILL